MKPAQRVLYVRQTLHRRIDCSTLGDSVGEKLDGVAQDLDTHAQAVAAFDAARGASGRTRYPTHKALEPLGDSGRIIDARGTCGSGCGRRRQMQERGRVAQRSHEHGTLAPQTRDQLRARAADGACIRLFAHR